MFYYAFKSDQQIAAILVSGPRLTVFQKRRLAEEIDHLFSEDDFEKFTYEGACPNNNRIFVYFGNVFFKKEDVSARMFTHQSDDLKSSIENLINAIIAFQQAPKRRSSILFSASEKAAFLAALQAYLNNPAEHVVDNLGTMVVTFIEARIPKKETIMFTCRDYDDCESEDPEGAKRNEGISNFFHDLREFYQLLLAVDSPEIASKSYGQTLSQLLVERDARLKQMKDSAFYQTLPLAFKEMIVSANAYGRSLSSSAKPWLLQSSQSQFAALQKFDNPSVNSSSPKKHVNDFFQ